MIVIPIVIIITMTKVKTIILTSGFTTAYLFLYLSPGTVDSYLTARRQSHFTQYRTKSQRSVRPLDQEWDTTGPKERAFQQSQSQSQSTSLGNIANLLPLDNNSNNNNNNSKELNQDHSTATRNVAPIRIQIPPRFVPGVAWQHHHQATLKLMNPRVSDQPDAIPETTQPWNNPNPVSNFFASVFSRPQLISASQEWKRLSKHADLIQKLHLRDFLKDKTRCDNMVVIHDGVYVDYSRQQATAETMQLLLDLANKQDLKGRIDAMVSGEKINFTEERAVLHTALRTDRNNPPVIVDGVNVIEEVHQVLDQVKHFTDGVRQGAILGYTGRRLRNIVSVGIGGSYLGPEFLHEVLKTEPEGINSALGYSLRFLSNVDPVDVERTCADLNPEETLIVVVSKTFTTAETMLNARTMRQWLWDFMGNDKEVVRKHIVACASVSATDKVAAFGIDTEHYFFRFWDWVGGRYSVCSAAGAVPISLLYGYELFEKFLQVRV